MKQFLIIISLFVQSSIIVNAQNNDVETIKKLNETWLRSYITKDTAALSKILANDFSLINPTGIVQNKQDNLQNMLDPSVLTLNVEFDKVEVNLLKPDVAILNAWTRFTFKANEKQLTGKNCYQDIYMKRKGRWYAVAAHVTLLGVE